MMHVCHPNTYDETQMVFFNCHICVFCGEKKEKIGNDLDKILYVISAVGQDRPGLVHSVTQILSDLHINIVDIEARSVRGHFTMFLVVDLSASDKEYGDLLQALEPIRSNFNMGIRVEPYVEGRRKVEKRMMIFTLMGKDRPGIVASVSGMFSENSINIETIKMIARGEYIATEITIDTSDVPDIRSMRRMLYAFSEDSGLDVSLRDYNIFQKQKQVVLFDCDSTIIQGEIIDELAKVAGVGETVKEMTIKAMNGEMSYTEAVKKRVSLLKGLTVEQLEILSKGIHLTPGAEELIATLNRMGYKVGVISGGFSFFTDYLKKRLNLDYVFANELAVENGVVTGKIKGGIVDAKRKGEILQKIAETEGISVDQIVAVGDGANDRFMLENAGLAIAFSPKEILKEYSDGMITTDNLSGLRYFLG
ncbi:MAG TPA: phosphoserine phosphatase SerB, partial [Desulfobacteraceae bacterium]|nr:phosphoserine phosphatase SerB [Desulfobacteraceae bacterium]